MKTKFFSLITAFVMILSLSVFAPELTAKAYPSAYPLPNLTGNQREDIVNIALSQKGYKKSGGTVYGAWYDSIKGTNFTNAAWCAMFVSWCANQAGIGQDILTYRSYVPDMVSDFKGRGQWHDRNYTPTRGDIIIVNSSGHVGIVTGVSGSTVYTIEGNKTSLGSACGTDSYTIGSSYITGYGSPNYNDVPIPNDDELGIPYPRPQVSSTVWLGKNGITSGNYVKWLQTALNIAENAGLDVDGQFGAGTTTAVKNFQSKYGLTQDGQAGTATINKLVEIIKGQNNISLTIDIWLSNSKMGSEISKFETENWYYLCYKIYDKNSSKLLSEVTSNYKDYSITELIYNPDGSIFNSYTYDNSDNNWIGFKPSQSGTYKWKIILKIGERESSAEKEFVVSQSKPNLEAPNLQVDVNGQDVTLSWNLVENATHYDVRIYYKDGTPYENYWGGSDTQNTLTVTLPAYTEFTAQVCSANKNYENCWNYCQPVSFKTGINMKAPNLQVDVNGQDVTFSWDLVDNATGYDLRIYNADGTSYADYWDRAYDTNSLTITMPANSRFSATICSKNSNYEECWSYCQPVEFETNINSYIIIFDSNNGNCLISNKIVYYNSKYGSLPIPIREGYTFDGWYTEKDGGTEITSDTIVTATSDQTLYAHWTLIPATTAKPILSGDTNGDGQIDIADVVAVSSYVGDSKNNSLSDKAIIAGDVHNTGDGITSGDVLMIQQYISGIIEKI